MDNSVNSIVFEEFPKIARLNRECVITEKIDGTNAQVIISDDGAEIGAASRSRLVFPGDDNHGFAAWVQANRDELLTLGPGRHFGEWWGQGIQKRYGANVVGKRFSLFNTARWGNDETRPKCCSVTPILYQGLFSTQAVEDALTLLRTEGSRAAPGCMNPEGVVVWHTAASVMFKVTLEKDNEWKGKSAQTQD